MEKTHGVGTTADTGKKCIWQATFLFHDLAANFFTDHILEVTHQLWVRVRTCDSSDNVESVIHIGNPVTKRFVHGVFQCAGT